MMKQIMIILVISSLALPAVAAKCSGGKCMSPRQVQTLKKKAMKDRLAKPLQVTPAIQGINQKIILLARNNAGGRNNVAIRNLQNQRNQLLKSQRR